MESHQHFQFEVPANGFEWLQPPFHYAVSPLSSVDRCTQEPALIAKASSPKSKPKEVVIPDKLFLKFAEVDPSSSIEILSFANQYGWLGIRPGSIIIPPAAPSSGKPTNSAQAGIRGELSTDWSATIREMRQVIEIWQAARKHDYELLYSRIRRLGPRHLAYVGPQRIIASLPVYESSQTVRLADSDSELDERDVVSWAFAYLIVAINSNRDEHVVSSLRRDPKTGRIAKFERPISLNGALWDQLATSISDFASIRPCEECGKSMIIGANEYRRSRQYCSDACRLRRFDARKREARRLHAKHVPLQEIADQVGTGIGQVRGWLKPRG